MGANKPKWASAVGAVFDLLQIAIAIAVIVLTSWRLLKIDVRGPSEIETVCVLDGSNSSDFISGTRFCAYAIAVGVISLLVSMIFGCVRNIFKCVTCNACAASRIVDIISDVALAVWWGAAFALFVRRGGAANDLGWPNRTERDGVIALAFGGMVTFIVDAAITMWTIVK